MESSLLYLPSLKVLQLSIDNVTFDVASVLSELQLSINDYYVTCNGRLVSTEDVVLGGCCYRIQPRLPGGKGGFGSMLRALGAQIEKTTNREACRDLSGRRMRDVNNEKKLREWAAKAGEREKEREERRKERRERLKAGATKHKFSDPEYDQQKTRIAEELDEALREALQKASSSTSLAEPVPSCSKDLKKRKATSTKGPNSKKSCDWIGVEADLSSSSSDAESDSGSQPTLERDEQCSSSSNDNNTEHEHNDSEHNNCSGSSADVAASCSTSSKERLGDSADVDEQSSNILLDNNSTVTNITTLQPVNLDDYESAEALEKLGLEVLKAALMERGLKCGGTVEQRAQRLFSVKGLSVDQIDKSLFAKPPAKKK